MLEISFIILLIFINLMIILEYKDYLIKYISVYVVCLFSLVHWLYLWSLFCLFVQSSYATYLGGNLLCQEPLSFFQAFWICCQREKTLADIGYFPV